MAIDNQLEMSEKELAVIREIHNNHLPGQRAIATRTGISLGLTNLIIKSLIKKGYIKAKQLNQKKIQYLLTPKGFSEKTRKSYNFTLKTINMLAGVRDGLNKLISDKIGKGYDNFELSGSGEIINIAEMFIKNIDGIKCSVIKQDDKARSDAILATISQKTGAREDINLIDIYPTVA